MRSRYFLPIVLLLLFFTLTAAPVISDRNNNSIRGFIYQKGHWNNYGLIIKLFKGSDLLETVNSSVNGSFHFKTSDPGKYDLYFFKDQLFVKQLSILHRRANKALKIRYTDKHFQPFYFTELFGFLAAVILLILGVISFRKVKNSLIAFSFFMVIASFILLDGTEFLQIILANTGKEILAGTIFPLKQLGLIIFGPAFFLFFQLFPRESSLIKNKILWVILGLLLAAESPILLSWSFFGSDYSFNSFWSFSFNDLRLLFITQVILFSFFSIKRIYDLRKDEEDLLIKNKLNTIIFSISVFFTVLIIFVLVPILFFSGKEFFSGQYSLVASFSTLLIGFVLFYALTKYKLVNISSLIKNSLAYSILIFVIILCYSLVISYINKLLSYIDNHLVNVYLLLFFLGLSFYLKDKVQNIIDQLFFGDQKEQKKALVIMSAQLSKTLDPQKSIKIIENHLKRLLKIKDIKIELGNSPALTNDHYSKNSGLVKTIQKDTPFPIELITKLRSNKQLGIIILGQKVNGKELSDNDLEILSAITSQAAIALNNALLHQESLNTQKQLMRSNQLAAIGTLSAGIAHEIKNPLAAINTLVKLLPKRYQDKNFRKQLIEIMPRQLERINNLIISLLDFSKQKKYKLTNLDLNEVITRCLKLVAIPAKKAKITIDQDLKAAAPIKGNEKELEQVIINLCLNAVEAMPQGGKLAIRTYTKNKRTVLEVKDSGCGITKDQLNKIFDPFVTTKTNGTGLGLAIIQKILNEHRANIKVTSSRKNGSTFTVIF